MCCVQWCCPYTILFLRSSVLRRLRYAGCVCTVSCLIWIAHEQRTSLM